MVREPYATMQLAPQDNQLMSERRILCSSRPLNGEAKTARTKQSSSDVRLAMPNPEFEGIARQIEASLKKAGGQDLADAVYKTKVADGSNILTHTRATRSTAASGRP
jgi:hypothetical protein